MGENPAGYACLLASLTQTDGIVLYQWRILFTGRATQGVTVVPTNPISNWATLTGVTNGLLDEFVSCSSCTCSHQARFAAGLRIEMDASTKFRMSATPTSCRVDGQTGFLACTRALELYNQLHYFDQSQFTLRFL